MKITKEMIDGRLKESTIVCNGWFSWRVYWDDVEIYRAEASNDKRYEFMMRKSDTHSHIIRKLVENKLTRGH